MYESSKSTTLPIARAIVDAYVRSEVKLPWFIDLLNINLNNSDLTEAKRRIDLYMTTLLKEGTRITKNVDFAG